MEAKYGKQQGVEVQPRVALGNRLIHVRNMRGGQLRIQTLEFLADGKFQVTRAGSDGRRNIGLKSTRRGFEP
jgi:hypothetical protein